MVKRIAETPSQHAGLMVIELMVVIAILGMLSSVVVFAVGIPMSGSPARGGV